MQGWVTGLGVKEATHGLVFFPPKAVQRAQRNLCLVPRYK